MAFDKENMTKLAALRPPTTANGGQSRGLWVYVSPDNLATTKAANYFDAYLKSGMITGDRMIAECTDGVNYLKITVGAHITVAAVAFS